MSRKKITPIMEECLALVYPMEQAAQRALWQKLWQQYMEGEKRQTAHPEVAELLTSRGAWLAYDQRDFESGYDLLVEFLRSPQASAVDYTYRANLMGMQFMLLLFLNREKEALQIVSQLLEAPRPSDVRSNLSSLRGYLGSFFMQQQADELASASITVLLYDIIQRLRRRKFRSIPHQATYDDLLTLSIEWSEAEERAREKRLAREIARESVT